MAQRPSVPQTNPVLQEARKRFVAEAGQALVELGAVLSQRFNELQGEPAPSREAQIRRDAGNAYQRARPGWVNATQRNWNDALHVRTPKVKKVTDGAFELVAPDAADNSILASRLALHLLEKAGSEYTDLIFRVKHLQGEQELESDDVLRPDALLLVMIEAWIGVGLERDAWIMVSEAAQKLLSERLVKAYANCNAFLIHQGVLPTIELSDRIARTPKAAARAAPLSGKGQAQSADEAESAQDESVRQAGGQGQQWFDGSARGQGGRADHAGTGGVPDGGHAQGPRYGAPQRQGHPYGPGGPGAGYGRAQGATSATGRGPDYGPSEASLQGDGGPAQPMSGAAAPGHQGADRFNAAEETRMMTGTTPLARARGRALGVMGQIKRLLGAASGGGTDFEATVLQAPSPRLAAAIAVKTAGTGGGAGSAMAEDYSPVGVAKVSTELRRVSEDLKSKAETKNEKAVIEIVALMFQAILQEDRIPPVIRVWFARLQMPVLRVALMEPDFFGTLEHPARQLIDRMGSCVLGFDSSDISGSALETEIKRVVQVIEQYPETGRRVYQLVYDEFQKFLGQFLTSTGSLQKMVGVAQQVEEKETLAIQYTIELRNMFKDIPVRDDVRQFLFKVWAEVLAVAAVRKGPQHAETLELKKLATDLVWAASAKPNRADRARVIRDLPVLLQKLRSGMSLIGISAAQQDTHVKIISDALADAFISKAQAIPTEQIAAMAERLERLEEFVSDEAGGDLPLDSENIEAMLGIDASNIDVVVDGGSKPSAAMLSWAQELQLGAWFTLDHNGRQAQVQFVWCSVRKHLNLFASKDGRSYLIQARRLAAYLQAGLLLPREEEALTVRATRDALGKLGANPERLLS